MLTTKKRNNLIKGRLEEGILRAPLVYLEGEGVEHRLYDGHRPNHSRAFPLATPPIIPLYDFGDCYKMFA